MGFNKKGANNDYKEELKDYIAESYFETVKKEYKLLTNIKRIRCNVKGYCFMLKPFMDGTVKQITKATEIRNSSLYQCVTNNNIVRYEDYEAIEKIVNQYNNLQWCFANKNDSWYVDLTKIIKIS